MEAVIDGLQYATTGKLDAFAQLHIARKLAPALPVINGMVHPDNVGKDKKILTVLMLAHINDADTNFVINKCMSVVVRKDASGKYVKIQTVDGHLMFDDIGMHALLELTFEVIEENIGDFFRMSLANLEQAESQPAA